jgi:hypothetical protein
VNKLLLLLILLRIPLLFAEEPLTKGAVKADNVELGYCTNIIGHIIKAEFIIDPIIKSPPSISLAFNANEEKAIILNKLQQALKRHCMLVTYFPEKDLVVISLFSDKKLWDLFFNESEPKITEQKMLDTAP